MGERRYGDLFRCRGRQIGHLRGIGSLRPELEMQLSGRTESGERSNRVRAASNFKKGVKEPDPDVDIGTVGTAALDVLVGEGDGR